MGKYKKFFCSKFSSIKTENFFYKKYLVGKYTNGQKSEWGINKWGKIQVGKNSSGLKSSGKISKWANILVGKTPSGQKSEWENYQWASVGGETISGQV